LPGHLFLVGTHQLGGRCDLGRRHPNGYYLPEAFFVVAFLADAFLVAAFFVAAFLVAAFFVVAVFLATAVPPSATTSRATKRQLGLGPNLKPRVAQTPNTYLPHGALLRVKTATKSCRATTP